MFMVVVGSLLMVMVDQVFFPVKRAPEQFGPPAPVMRLYEHSEIADYELGRALGMIEEEEGDLEVAGPLYPLPALPALEAQAEGMQKIIREPADLKVKGDILPLVKEKKNKVAYVPPPPIPGKGMVAIIIDDMGMDRKRSHEASNLPAPMTLAFLPYAPKLDEITKEAKAKGHELIIHVPMQPLKSSLNPGPLVLRDDMTEESFSMALVKMFSSFEGYDGINNHMGSKLTQDRKAMDMVMEALAERHLLFVDSKTIQTSIAAESAAAHGLAYGERDVFLDHVNDIDFVRKALHELEVIAKKRGYAIAIGHPKDVTIAGLREWLPTLEERGLTLVPVNRVVKRARQEVKVEEVNFFGPLQPQSQRHE